MIETRRRFEGIETVAFPAIAVQLSPVKIFVAGRTLSRYRFVKHGFAEPAGKRLFFLQVAFFAGQRGVFAL